METPQISPDDVADVNDMAEKLETHIESVIKDTDRRLAISALVSSFVTCLLNYCEDIDECLMYRNLIFKILDRTIRSVKTKRKETAP